MYTYPEALNAFEKIAKDLFARARPDWRVEVRVVADSVTGTASVDWNLNLSGSVYAYQYITINLPVKPATYRMSDEEFENWVAYNLHEVGHPLWTDKATWTACVAARQHRLVNALEDVREEKLTIDAGLALNAKQIFSRLIASLQAKNLANGYDPNDVQNIGWTMSFLGRHANGYDIDADTITKRLDPKGIVAGILPWAQAELKDCKSTQDCWDLAKKIIAAVNAAKAKEPEIDVPEIDEPIKDGPIMPPPKGGQNEHRGQPEVEQGGDIPEEEKKPEGDQQGGESGDKEPESPEAEEPKAEEPEEEKPFSDEDIAEVDMTPNDKDTMSSSSTKGKAARDVITAMRRVLKNPVADKDIVGRNTDNSVELVTGDASKMGQQRQLLARALKKNEQDDYDGGRLSGRLNGRALARVAVRDGRVFGKRTVTEGYDTDVQILVDGSGSMGGRNIKAASTLALVVAQAASQVGVDCTAHVFNDRGLHAATRGRSKPLGRKFAYMQNQILGGTPLTENLLRATKLQKARAGNKRKIMFLITDGGCNMGPEALKAAGQYVEQVEGVEIANLHIGYQVMGTFRNEVAVNVNDVSKSGLRQLTNLLERGL